MRITEGKALCSEIGYSNKRLTLIKLDLCKFLAFKFWYIGTCDA